MLRRIGLVAAVVASAVLLATSPALAKSQKVNVKIDDDGCPAKLRIKAGTTTFKVTNKGSGDVSEFEVLSADRVIGEVENIAPGLNREFSLTLEPGNYSTLCPGGSLHSTGKLVVKAPPRRS